ncbi:MAG: hypothetical protein LBC98_03620, partial [Prevotellaceae bacterium]|nr:hypothetical protein [Prevotellaceae bacterium]
MKVLKLSRLMTLVVALILALACDKKDEPSPTTDNEEFITLGKTSVSFGFRQDSAVIAVTSNVKSINVSVSEPAKGWCQASITNNILKIKVLDNTEVLIKNAVVTLS